MAVGTGRGGLVSVTNEGHLNAVQVLPIAKRRGSERACMAVAHHLLIVIWHLHTEQATYTEMGADYFERCDDPIRRQRFLVKQLEALGHTVTLTPAAA